MVEGKYICGYIYIYLEGVEKEAEIINDDEGVRGRPCR